jgi:5-methylcytosine-specific restriction endonuclease McrBC GTP-binding regulatory subunit McrB
VGLSTPESVLNQNTFGYVIDDALLDSSEAEPASAVPDEPAPTSAPSDAPRPRRASTFTLEWLSSTTGLDAEQVGEIIDTLRGASPQVLLCGPPGTSKTWIARQVATYLTGGDPARNRFVQFHPSYSYESFVEGLRPVTRTGGIQFDRTPGVVMELVEAMARDGLASDPDTDYVIVIDEVNRANLPRVLGELMFLFEYRDESIRMQYSAEFKLPSNLRFLGTMNTADRSIRSIDIALRRRFEVFEFGPDVRILERHYATDNELQVAGLLDGFEALNEALTERIDRHHAIGHAFFMRPRLDPPALRAIWRRKVFPLIEEFFFDQPEVAAEFKLERFWPTAARYG